MTKAFASALFGAFFLCAAASGAWAQTGIVFERSTALGTDGLTGWIGSAHQQDRITLRSREPNSRLFFFWDSADMLPRLQISDWSGKPVADIDLTKGNIVTLTEAGNYTCVLSAVKGSGHWFCVLLGTRQWDP
jgi:hypothetical protein